MARGDYAGLGRPADDERTRLEHLARGLNPGTQRLVRALGIRDGWRCLEIGAAEGSMSTWLASEVGPSGHVVAADIDVRFLAELEDVPNLEVREVDVRTGALEPGHYDLAYCRTLLLHLPDPAATLARLTASLRPGGWLLCQEPDTGPVGALDLDHPRADDFARITHTIYRWLRARGRFDSYFGRRVPDLLASANLVDIDVDARVRIVRGGSEDTQVYRRTFAAMEEMLVAKGAVAQSDLTLLQEIYADPTFDQVSELQFAAWGRRPGVPT